MSEVNCNKCGVCCTEISISSAIHIYHPKGKPAGVKCAWLGMDNLCQLFDSPFRPEVCTSFKASKMTCGDNADEAVELIRKLERATCQKSLT